MPKSFRKCSFCPNTSFSNPDIVIFSTNEYGFLCENHFSDNDIRSHQGSKRFASSFLQVMNIPVIQIENGCQASGWIACSGRGY